MRNLCIVVVLLVLLCTLSSTMSTASNLRVGYYKNSCPQAEAIVQRAVNKAISRNPGLGAGLIRMHFHDCFVRGCDASVVIKSTPGNSAEVDHPANNPSLRGFEVIDEAKSQIEAVCPNTVSCADIIAFAARDSSYRLGGISYTVPSGRRDGRVSLVSEAGDLPRPDFNTEQLIQNFDRRGMSADEMVTLSGAHSIGVSRCSSFERRLYTFNSTLAQDPTMHQKFAAFLKTKCPVPETDGSNTINPIVPLDHVTPNRLDNVYYGELTRGRGLLGSDQTLFNSGSTQRMVWENARNGRLWAAKFARAMVRMGKIEVLTGSQGEIRRQCGVVN